MIGMPLLLKQLQRMDNKRSGVPGEHWATFGTGLLLLRYAGRGHPPVLRVAAGLASAVFIWRAISGRDGFLPQIGLKDAPWAERAAMPRLGYTPKPESSRQTPARQDPLLSPESAAPRR